jgi:2-dehydro-3-deoxygluconokinase
MSSTVINHDLITLGESMWRLSPSGSHERLEAARQLDIHLGGAESNVASGLSRLGKRTAWWSRLPDNPLGRNVANTLRAHGVDISAVRWGGGRLGTYFVEFGHPPRATDVYYDRANSAASQMQPDDFPWEQLRHTRWLHLTGITPALSTSCLQTVQRAVEEARRAGVSTSFDLNYRAKLWTPQQAAPVLDELAAQCTLVIAAERDVKTLFGLEGEQTLERLYSRWNKATVVMTCGDRGACGWDERGRCDAASFPVNDPIRIGGGDAFAVGLLCTLMDGGSLADALIYGNAVAALKMTMPGDIALVTRREVDDFLRNQPGSVLR